MIHNFLPGILKLAEMMEGKEDGELNKLCAYFDSYIEKHFVKTAHFVPDNDGVTPNPWRKNMDYAEWENSPYYGSVSEFMNKFPGGIKDWLKYKRETKEDVNKLWDIKKANEEEEIKLFILAHYIPEGGDDVDKFEEEPHLYSGDMDKYNDVAEYIKKWHKNMEQDSTDAAYDAVNDFISYYKILKKKRGGKKRGKK